MPIPIGNGKNLSRQFILSMDANYGYFYAMSDEEYEESGGLLWYNEGKQISQLRSIYMCGPMSWETEIMNRTMVVDVARWGLDVNGVRVCAWGVFFGGYSKYSTGQLGSGSWNDTSPAPLLQGLLSACNQIMKTTKYDPSINDIKLRVSRQSWGSA